LQQQFLPIFEQISMRHRFAAKQNAAYLRTGVFEREINMTRTLKTQIRDFAADPNRANLFFQRAADLRGQFSDRKDFAFRHFRFRRKQFAEVPLGFGFGHTSNGQKKRESLRRTENAEKKKRAKN